MKVEEETVLIWREPTFSRSRKWTRKRKSTWTQTEKRGVIF